MENNVEKINLLELKDGFIISPINKQKQEFVFNKNTNNEITIKNKKNFISHFLYKNKPVIQNIFISKENLIEEEMDIFEFIYKNIKKVEHPHEQFDFLYVYELSENSELKKIKHFDLSEGFINDGCKDFIYNTETVKKIYKSFNMDNVFFSNQVLSVNNIEEININKVDLIFDFTYREYKLQNKLADNTSVYGSAITILHRLCVNLLALNKRNSLNIQDVIIKEILNCLKKEINDININVFRNLIKLVFIGRSFPKTIDTSSIINDNFIDLHYLNIINMLKVEREFFNKTCTKDIQTSIDYIKKGMKSLNEIQSQLFDLFDLKEKEVIEKLNVICKDNSLILKHLSKSMNYVLTNAHFFTEYNDLDLELYEILKEPSCFDHFESIYEQLSSRYREDDLIEHLFQIKEIIISLCDEVNQ